MSACFNDGSRQHKRARAIFTLACVRCFDTMAVAKTVRLVVRLPGESRTRCNAPTVSAKIPYGCARVACFEAIASRRSRISPWRAPTADFRLLPFSLPRKRKISEIIDRRLTNGKPSARSNQRSPLDILRRPAYTLHRIQFRIHSFFPFPTIKLCANGQKMDGVKSYDRRNQRTESTVSR